MDAAESTDKNNFERTGRTLGKPLIFELMLRGGGIVLAVSSIISSSVCLNKLSAVNQDHRPAFYNIQQLVTYFLLTEVNSQAISNTRAAAGWILFLSLVACVYQIFIIFQLFFYLKLMYMKIPVGKSLWYLFPLMDLVISVLCTVGYLCPAIAMAAYSSQWTEPIVKRQSGSNPSFVDVKREWITPYIQDYVLPVVFTCILAFGSAARSVGNIVFILLAKIKFKWPPYFIPDN